MNFFQLFKNIMTQTETVGESSEYMPFLMLEVLLLLAEPVHLLWGTLRRRSLSEKLFACIIIGIPALGIAIVQICIPISYYRHTNLYQNKNIYSQLTQPALYQDVLCISVSAVLCAIVYFAISLWLNPKNRKHKFFTYISTFGVETVFCIITISISVYQLYYNSHFLVAMEPTFTLHYVYLVWHLAIKAIILLAVLLVTMIFYCKEQEIYSYDKDAHFYLQAVIRRQSCFSLIIGIFLMIPIPLAMMAGVFSSLKHMSVLFVVLSCFACLPFIFFAWQLWHYLVPHNHKIFRLMREWGNETYLLQMLCIERYSGKEPLFKNHRWILTEHFLFDCYSFWKYDVFYLKNVISVQKQLRYNEMCAVLTLQNGETYFCYRCPDALTKEIQSLIEGNHAAKGAL